MVDEIKKAIVDRINNSLIGGFVIAFCLWNVEPILVLTFGNYDLVDKIEWIKTNSIRTSHLLTYPFLTAAGYIIISPWLIVVNEWYNNFPSFVKTSIKHRYDEKILQFQKQTLETKREFIKVSEDIEEQDKTLYKKDLEIFNHNNGLMDEETFYNTFRTLKRVKQVKESDIKQIETYINHAKLTSGRYYNALFDSAHAKFVTALENVFEFMRTRFYLRTETKENERVYSLYDGPSPENNFSEDADKLENLTNEVFDSYTTYRLLIRKHLQV